MNITPNSLLDLEFPTVLSAIEKFAYTDLTKIKITDLTPSADLKRVDFDLNTTNEYLSSLESQNHFPFHEFEEISEELKLLPIENIYLEATAVLRLKTVVFLGNELIAHTEKFKDYYPNIYTKTNKISTNKEILAHINKVFTKFGELKDDASNALLNLRRELKKLQKIHSEQFSYELTKYIQLGFLDEIRESVLDDKRVLAVVAMHRKKVKGRFLGTSKTGSIAFIEPDAVIKSQRDLEEYREEEKKEIVKILRKLTQQIALHQESLFAFHKLLLFFDFTRAKAMYSNELQSCMPIISTTKKLNLINALHPILFLGNKAKNEPTIAQSLALDPKQRIIVISGPNAGGKSITLKTIGLLQVMFQSGILVPVHPKSEMCVFGQLFTDIGDNQSIENHLSTYSYRLKNMTHFLKRCNADTLLLIDEFGTGSDPELGGALAEVFMEEFYEMKSFGIFTTHYTNIKIQIENLDEAINACMLFDKKKLSPMYKLELGQAGSSFTFEVAEKNGIPFRVINRAKKKIESEKLNLNKTIIKLQEEKYQIQNTKIQLAGIETEAANTQKELEETNLKTKNKLIDFQVLYDSEMKTLQFGKRFEQMADNYLLSKNKKELITEFLKMVEIENTKKNKTVIKSDQKQKAVEQKKLTDALKPIVEELKKEIVLKEEKIVAEKQLKISSLKIGDRVKIKDSTSVGTVMKIEKQTVSINYGLFTTKININELYKI